MPAENNSEEEISERALAYAAKHKKTIVADAIKNFTEEEYPISIFMAGSPGAGKTESSRQIAKNIGNVLRIDADALRNHFQECGYNGKNSHLFQRAASRLVHKIHDAALEKKISFLLDGTFANESIAMQNIERSLKRERSVFIVFVYQSPWIAWNFVLAREVAEGRRIRMEDFAEKFCASREVVNKMKEKFKDKIELMLLSKDLDGADKFFKKSVERIDDHIPKKYTESEILAEIKNID